MISETKRKATWQELADRVDELQEKLDNSINKDKLIEAIDFAINATDSTDDYSIGLCNGMIYVKALLTDGNPDYKKCQNNSISKDKIREKIEMLKKIYEFANVKSEADYCLRAKINILEDLLKEEWLYVWIFKWI